MTIAPPAVSKSAFAAWITDSAQLADIGARQRELDDLQSKIGTWTDLDVLLVTWLDDGRHELHVNEESFRWVPADVLDRLDPHSHLRSLKSNCGATVVSCPFGDVTAVAVLPRYDAPIPADATIAAAEQGWDIDQLSQWWSRRATRDPKEVERLLSLASELHDSNNEQLRSEHEVESLAEQIDSTYEEISLLHFLAQNQQVSRDTDDLATACLARLRDSIGCEATAAWLLGGAGRDFYLADGEMPFDELELAMAIARFDRHPWPQPLVQNNLAEPLFDGGPHVRALIIVPVTHGAERIGWIVAVNPFAGREFGTVEASLIHSVAVNFGTHLQNAAVVAEQEDLLLSFVRSLVSSLDAKDAYTRGHSERVARIARRIAEELELDEKDVEDIYLSGLLHDIGKIGVDDAILSKPGRLTDEEFAEIQKHPAIGYHILGGIKRLSHILPGVRSHHESFDGSGYPDGLSGYEIPMMARVLAVADSYDAMGSDRPYRSGMPLEKLEGILRDGRGTQWDAEIIDAYFRCRDDIRNICVDWAARRTS